MVSILPYSMETLLSMVEKRPVILCVDDDTDDQVLFVETIGEMAGNVRVACAMNGAEALRYLEKFKNDGDLPSLIMLDINMPLLNGKETLVQIKKDSILKSIPVVIFTTSSNDNDVSFFMNNGASRFITKPVKLQELKNVLGEMLQFLGVYSAK